MERVRTPDEETDEAYDAAYAKDSVTPRGWRLHPRDLDAYTAVAYELAALADEDDWLRALPVAAFVGEFRRRLVCGGIRNVDEK